MSARRTRNNPPNSRRPWLWGTLSLAAGLAVVVYMVMLALPYLALTPTLDTQFGKLNQCLRQGGIENSLGFAVSPDGQAVASFTGTTVVFCEQETLQPGVLNFPGVTSIALDFSKNLWLGTPPKEGQNTHLWRWSKGQEKPQSVHAVVPMALVPHPKGVVALESSGLLMSFDMQGNLLAEAQVAGAWPCDAQLTVNVDGSLLAVLAHESVITFKTETLSPVSAASPCKATFLWWTLEREKARIECGGADSVALEFNVSSGQFETLPKRSRRHTTLVPLLRQYVQVCDHLPCRATDTSPSR